MPKKASSEDARLVLRLYDLRRETEMRKARDWWAAQFWPESVEDYMNIAMGIGKQESKWLRQVASFWEMAATLVNHGALNEKLFLELSCSGEMYFIFGKLRPFLKEIRERTHSPEAFENIEKVILGSAVGRRRLAVIEGNIRRRREMLAKAKVSAAVS